MSAADLVLVCALELLGRSADRLPRIEILETRPAGVSPNATAFVDPSQRAIYLMASGAAFSDAMAAQSSRAECRDLDSLRMVASIIAHELWHVTHGPDEVGAYYAQLMELLRLGLGPGRWPYHSVMRSLEAVLKSRDRGGRTAN